MENYKTITEIGNMLNKKWLRKKDIPDYIFEEAIIKKTGSKIYYDNNTVGKIINYLNLPTEEKIKQTSLKKYGVEHFTKSIIVKQKQEKTNIKKYGTKSTAQVKEIKDKQKETLFKKYGVEVPSKSKILIDKARKTLFESKQNIDIRENIVYGDKYKICSGYNGEKSYIYIYCNDCGKIFKKTVHSHINNKSECPYCNISTNKLNKDFFIEKAKKLYGEKYSYSEVEYINSKTKVKIYCNDCKEYFWQNPNDHLSNHGHSCVKSKQEENIKKFLIENHIPFDYQKEYDDCRGKKRKLPFDFYLPEYDLLIEVQGEQHSKSKKFFGGEKYLKERIRLDNIKKEYAEKNHNFFTINYNEK